MLPGVGGYENGREGRKEGMLMNEKVEYSDEHFD